MGNDAQESIYLEACGRIELLGVIRPFEEKAKESLRISKLFQKAGDFKDAPELAGKYRKMADEYAQAGREEIYRRACSRLETAGNAGDFSRVESDLKKITGYKDTDVILEKCREKQAACFRRSNIRLIAGMILAVLAIAAAGFLIKHMGADSSPEAEETEKVSVLEMDETEDVVI